MTDETRNLVTRRSALGLMGIGAVGVASETLGFTQLSADRGVNVAVADDTDAALRIGVNDSDDGNFDNELDSTFDGDQFVQFRNDSSEEISSLELTITKTDDGGSVDIDDVSGQEFGFSGNTLDDGNRFITESASLDSGEESVIEISPSGDNTLEFDLTAEFNGTTLSLTREAEFNEPQ